MVNGLTLSKIITLNTGIDNVPDNVFFSAKICKDVVNHNCVKNRRNGQNVAEEHPNTIKYKKAKFAKRFDTKKTSSQEVRSKYNIFKVISVIFGVIILLSIVILGVFLLRRRSSRKAAKPSACKLKFDCNSVWNGLTNRATHEEPPSIFFLYGPIPASVYSMKHEHILTNIIERRSGF